MQSLERVVSCFARAVFHVVVVLYIRFHLLILDRFTTAMHPIGGLLNTTKTSGVIESARHALEDGENWVPGKMCINLAECLDRFFNPNIRCWQILLLD